MHYCRRQCARWLEHWHLRHCGISASDAVYEYWAYETSTLDSAFDTGDTKYFRGSNYYDKISMEGKLWIPFGDYRTSGDAATP